MRKVAPTLVLACALVACGTSPGASAPTSPLPAETMAPAAVPVATPVPTSEPAPAPRARHVFVIVMENRAPAEANEAHLSTLPRLQFRFDRKSLGRLRQLIDLLNREVE